MVNPKSPLKAFLSEKSFDKAYSYFAGFELNGQKVSLGY